MVDKPGLVYSVVTSKYEIQPDDYYFCYNLSFPRLSKQSLFLVHTTTAIIRIWGESQGVKIASVRDFEERNIFFSHLNSVNKSPYHSVSRI